MVLELLLRHLVTLFTILLFGILLWRQKSPGDAELNYFWLTLLSCLVLVVADAMEEITSADPSLRFWRIFFSVVGYAFRSTAALGLLLVVTTKKTHRFLLWIPALITLLVSATAFFSDIAFGYNENYSFSRGPLGFVAFLIPLLYVLAIIWVAFKYYTDSKGLQRYIILICALFCLVATAADTLYYGNRLTEAILISSIFIYMVLRAHDNRHDTLTGLLNRYAFYEDCARFNNRIAAVASLDMNDLKTINDSLGHAEGDAALISISKCIKALKNPNAMTYRMGGDEFVILFFEADEAFLERTEKQIKESVMDAGYSISAGFALRNPKTKLEDALRESDRQMYEDKELYYQTHKRAR